MRKLPVFLAALGLTGAALAGTATSPAAAQTTARPEFVTGTGDGTAPHVVLYDKAGNALGGFMAFAGNTGARVASGDIDGDIQPDIVVATGRGVASQVSVFSLQGVFKGSFSPYGGFPGGVNVGVGDVDGDTIDEIVTAAGPGGGPHVIVWDWNKNAGTAAAKFGWYAYDANFRGGVNLSVHDLVKSTRADVVTAPGAGGGPHVRIWDLGSGGAVEDAGFMAYGANFTGGVNVGGGEIDGQRAIVTGPGRGGGPHVRVFSTNGGVRKEFFAYAGNFTGGVNVSFTTAQGGDLGRIITAPASHAGPHVRVFNSSGGEYFGFMAYGGNPINGIHVNRIPQLGSTNNTNQNGSSSS